MSGEVWHTGDGMDPEAPAGANTTEDEVEPEEADLYEDEDVEPHEFRVDRGGSNCIACGEFYAEGNHTN